MRPSIAIAERSRRLEQAQLWRAYPGDVRLGAAAIGLLDARSNDYLGLAARAVSRETAEGALVSAAEMLGAGAARLISGTTVEHVELERELAEWLQAEATLSFSSAYAANVGVVASLGERGDTIFSDALNHASIIDGCRLSRAEVVVYPHLDIAAVEAGLHERRHQPGQRWVVTESYFGMDGNAPDLARLRDACDAHDAGLVVDEAHALGVFGDEGRGLCFASGVSPDVLVGGFGKAFGAQGGFVAGARVFVEWFWNRARTFVFSTATSPLLTRGIRGRLVQVRSDGAGRGSLRAREAQLERRLRAAGVALPPGRVGPIFPVILGREVAALAVAGSLMARGVRVQAIRPPTVPPGTSRLRLIVRADMTEGDVETLADALIECLREQAAEGAEGGGMAEQALQHRGPMEARGEGRGGGCQDREERAGGGPLRSAGSTSMPIARAERDGGVDAGEFEGHLPGTVEEVRMSAGGGRASTPAAVKVLDAAAGVRRAEGASAPVQVLSGAGSGEESIPGGAKPRPREGSEPGGSDAAALQASGPVQSSKSRSAAPERRAGAPELPGREPSLEASTGPRWVVLGTGTGVGKTFVSVGLVKVLARTGAVAGLKPIETGIGADIEASDARSLERASFHVKHPTPHPLYAFERPLTPSLAARLEHRQVALEGFAEWLARTRRTDPDGPPALVIETAGGVFSPLGRDLDNFRLGLSVEPARWVLVAMDRLGVLHEVASALHAMRALGRSPDCIVLNAPAEPDPSTGTNLAELRQMGVNLPIVRLARGDHEALSDLL